MRKLIWVISLLMFCFALTACSSGEKKQSDAVTKQSQEQQVKEQQAQAEKARKAEEQRRKEQAAAEKQQAERQKQQEERQKQQAKPLTFSNIGLEELPNGAGTARYTVRAQFVIKNTSNTKQRLDKTSFIIKKDGINTVKAHHSSGGFSESIDRPLYMKDTYELFPGDAIAVSLDFPIGSREAALGSTIYYEEFNEYYPVVTVSK